MTTRTQNQSAAGIFEGPETLEDGTRESAVIPPGQAIDSGAGLFNLALELKRAGDIRIVASLNSLVAISGIAYIRQKIVIAFVLANGGGPHRAVAIFVNRTHSPEYLSLETVEIFF